MRKMILICLLCLLSVSCIYKQKYTLHYSGDNVGTITIKEDSTKKITITPKMSKISGIAIDNEICPLLPKRFYIKSETQLITIEGNTTIVTFSDCSWEKTIVDGNTTIFSKSDNSWKKIVVEGNTTTVTKSTGWYEKTVVDGNITTVTYSALWEPRKVSTIITTVEGNTTTKTDSDGQFLEKIVVDGNTTKTSLYGHYGRTEKKTVVDGNTTTTTCTSYGCISYYGSWSKTVVDKKGHNIYIFEESWQDRSEWYGTP